MTRLPTSVPDTEAPLAPLAARYLAALRAADADLAIRTVLDDGLKAGLGVDELHLGVIEVAQREIGELWQRDEITVAEEHVATAISQLVVATLYRHLQRDRRNGHTVVVSCPAGEQHELGARIAADQLEAAGYRVLFTGANTPAGELAALTERTRPSAVVISAATALALDGVRGAVAALRGLPGARGLPVFVGGCAARLMGRGVGEATVASGDARRLVALVNEAVMRPEAA